MSSHHQRGGVLDQSSAQQSISGHHILSQRPRSSNLMLSSHAQQKVNEPKTNVQAKPVEPKKGKEEQQSSQGVDLESNAHHKKPAGVLSTQEKKINKIPGLHQLKRDGLESEQLNHSSLDTSSIASHPQSVALPHKHTFNIESSSTLRNGAAIVAELSKPLAKNVVNNNLQVLHQDLSNNQRKSEQFHRVDPSGNAIKGRKVNSPRLIVVKELKEQEDNDELLDTLVKNQQRDHLHRDTSIHGVEKQKRQARSVEKYNQRRKSKERVPLQQSQQQNHIPPRAPIAPMANHNKEDKAKPTTLRHNQKSNKNNQQTATRKANHRSSSKETKSSRDIKTSMAFNDLLNQLDKDPMQQSHNIDFKNRTHEILQADHQEVKISKIAKQFFKPQKSQGRSSSQEARQPSKSRSQERQHAVLNQVSMANIVQSLKAVLPKSIASKHFFPSDHRNGGVKITGGSQNMMTDATPDKSSFLQSEHGRCVTSQTIHQSQPTNMQIGRTQSTQNLNTSTGSNNLMKAQKRPMTNIKVNCNDQQMHKDQSSPDRSGSVNTSHCYRPP